MAELIRMPRMSDTMTEAVIVAWHKKVGDKIKPGEVLAEVETDKATMELESYQEGTLLYIGVEKGKSIAVDGLLAIVGKPGEDFKKLLEPTNPPAQEKAINPAVAPPISGTKISLPPGAKEIRMPLLSDTMTEGKIVSWNKKVGDKVKSDDVLCEVETDKATMEVVGYEEGTLLYVGVEAGKAAKINEIIAIIGKPGTDVSAYVKAEKETVTAPAAQPVKSSPAPAIAATAAPVQNMAAAMAASNGRIKASPLAKKLARDKGIELTRITGTGDGGRITKKDVDSFHPGATPAVPAFRTVTTESFTDIPLTQMRKTIARRLSESKYSAPHFYLTMEINVENLKAVRESVNEFTGTKVSFNDFAIKACAMALRQHPAVNSSWMGDFIRQHDHIHIGSAVALPEGLIVPVIKFADQRSVMQIAAEAKTLYSKAREKKLEPQEFSGNTFTISNLGMMDIEEFTAIINPPDSCILAIGSIREVVVRKEHGFDVTHVMKVTLSCDHRSVDGALGAAFLQTFKKIMENPVSMLL